ncbi:MAG: RNA polymerase sigma factor [Candidatus Pacebacteria bacterium]|nr:RNA polymerase sigma factor [Candidatus Paceibacterota bacterium]
MDFEINKKTLISARNGSLSAFEEILYFYEKQIFNYIYRLVNEKESAEDLTQETFIKVFKEINKIKPDLNFKSWVYKIATNKAYDWFRKKKRLAAIPILSNTSRHYPGVSEDNLPYTDDKSKEIEITDEINRALEKLNPREKTALILFYRQDLSCQEIADALSIPLNTVKTHLYRAKKSLKNYLTKPVEVLNNKKPINKKYEFNFSTN